MVVLFASICVHKAIALCYLKAQNLLSKVETPDIESNVFKGQTTLNLECKIESSSTIDTPILNFDRMCEYIHSQKRYSENNLRDESALTCYEVPKILMPAESKCFFCAWNLAAPVLVSKTAMVSITLIMCYYLNAMFISSRACATK